MSAVHADEAIAAKSSDSPTRRVERTDYEEFLRSPLGALRRYTDRDGRPLCGEAVIDDAEFRASLEQRRCQYPGSRHNHPLPLNASALKQMTRAWDRVLELARTLHRLFVPGAVPNQDAVAWAMRVAYAAVCLPLFLLYRHKKPMNDGKVPGYVSALHKASIDIATTAQLMLVERVAAADPAQSAHGDVARDIIDFAERAGLFIGQKGVCAGPPQLIRELVLALVHGERGTPGPRSPVTNELGDLRGAARYIDELTKIWCAKHLFNAYSTRLIDRLEHRVPAGAAYRLSLADYLERIHVHRRRESQPILLSNVVSRQERALRSLDVAAFRRLLRATEAAADTLGWRGGQRRCAGELLQRMRGREAVDGSAITEVERIADARLGPDVSAVAAAGLLDAARAEQSLLRFFASTEANIKAALGLPEASRPLSMQDLGTVFGVMPTQYLGELLGIETAIDDRHIALSSSRGAVLVSANESAAERAGTSAARHKA